MIFNKIRYIESGLLKATSTITWKKDVFQKKAVADKISGSYQTEPECRNPRHAEKP